MAPPPFHTDTKFSEISSYFTRYCKFKSFQVIVKTRYRILQ
nr:MAG TPA: hypothetical protein [Caudoviricetes sp.]